MDDTEQVLADARARQSAEQEISARVARRTMAELRLAEIRTVSESIPERIRAGKAAGITPTEAIRLTGLSRSTVYRHLREAPDGG